MLSVLWRTCYTTPSPLGQKYVYMYSKYNGCKINKIQFSIKESVQSYVILERLLGKPLCIKLKNFLEHTRGQGVKYTVQ